MFNILEIHRMTTHNGPGYRTCVHFMGCPLSCVWCSTPESQQDTGIGFNPSRCIGCGSCIHLCPAGALTFDKQTNRVILNRAQCKQCFSCVKECYSNALWQYGKMIALDELKAEILKDKIFFEKSGGGVTFSGGECLSSVTDELISLFEELKSEDITIYLDTCGYAPWSNIERILPYVDGFLWDLKIMNPDMHRSYTGVDNALILENLYNVAQASKADIFIRVPLVPQITDTDENILAICSFVRKLKHYNELHLLPYHNMGKSRYDYCGKQLKIHGERQSKTKLEYICELVRGQGITCKIVG